MALSHLAPSARLPLCAQLSRLYKELGLVTIRLTDVDCNKAIGRAVAAGVPLLCESVGEDLGALEPLLSKTFVEGPPELGR